MGRKNEAIVIAGSTGVGKTELARRYSNVLDLDSADFSKSADWPHNYIEAVEQAKKKYDYVLIFTKLEDLDLDYEFFFPEKSAIPEYEQRLYNRGGRLAKFAKTVYADYDRHLKTAQAYGKPIIFLGPGETLESFLLRNEGKYPKLVRKGGWGCG